MASSMDAIRVMYHPWVRRSAALFVLTLLPFAIAGCEKPRERACRALLIQAKNADDARTAAAAEPRVAASRARSAARWIRSNAVEDAELKKEASALSDALERLADARVRLADASEVLGAADAAELLARAQRIDGYLAATDEVPKIRRKVCPWYDPQGLIEDPRCAPYDAVPDCNVEGTTLAEHAERCVKIVEGLADVAVARADVTELAAKLDAHAKWMKSLPPRPQKDFVDRARAVPLMIADRGRADADVTTHVRSLEAKCAH